ncbi:serine/threonine-protein kinase PknK [Archangium sp.]|uniref:serine/threonine-protein kinase n=1 Tax=Archangium sp. TaxID=1872627 RepID=UPI002D4A8010|nr:protein kinase [Archangium sp.]HYO54720.1 protein kinase [Archangium sp.]
MESGLRAHFMDNDENDRTQTVDDDDTAPSNTPPGVLPRGTVVGGRFTLEVLAGRGGMGFVYRAVDGTTGKPVALKLMHGVTSPEARYRFNREATLLEGLHHPAIVSYVAKGITDRGQPYLAMEWLEGEVLAHRLLRKPLTVSETLSLLRCVAEALTTSHRQNIVHRDIKPSNLFLRGGRPEDVVLLDFGLARHAVPSLLGVTGSHIVLGTPGYMAPEQASSEPEILPTADIFSLGCVLYECLTGKPPFEAPHFAAALAKILFAEPAPLHTLRPGLLPGMQVLVDRMLAKDPRRRLPDAASLLEALGALESVPELLLPRSQEEARPPRLTRAEQQLVSVLLVSSRAMASGEGDSAWRMAMRDSLRTMLAPYGARVELLVDGSLVATLVPERGTATDQAAMAARCALTFKERWPEAAVVLVTGLGVFDERLPVGEAMDRAGRLLHRLEQTPTSSVVMDEVTAGLLGPGFQLFRSSSGTFVLQGEQLGSDTSRPLLGKPTPCVGREQELALLDFTLNACIEESSVRALLVTAPAGVGKSRLRHEFLRRLERREQRPLVLLGRGDPMSTGASYGLLGQALRKLCGVEEGESLESRRVRLYQRVALHLPEAEAQEAVEFLGELCAIPFPEEYSPRLHAARSDPQLMSTQMGRALATFLGAECVHQPVLLVLEDLHWSDALTVKLVDGLLRELAEQPFMVLALARPEVKELFPGLWAKRLQEVPLNVLSRKACARLVREVLGLQVPESVMQRAVEQSDGNALFLEELIRMAAEGRGEETPETVLAVLQARLMRMEPGMRQVLLAASIFGRTFWTGGVGDLLGRQVANEALEQLLRLLVEQEVIERQPDSRFSTEAEYRFRHALVRDAAYGLVPDSHRPVGHRLAGTWLEQLGEPDPLVLATHHQLGGQPERAVHFYTRAAEQLFDRYDMPGTMRCVETALACGVDGGKFVRLRALQAVVAFWMDDMPKSLALGGAVVDELEVGSRLWCWLMGGQILGSVYNGMRQEQLTRLKQLLRSTTPAPEAVDAYHWAVACMGLSFVYSGSRRELEDWLGQMRKVVADGPSRGWTRYIDGFFHHFFEAKPWHAFLQAEQGTRDFRELGAERDALIVQTFLGLALAALGDVSGAVERMREVLTASRRLEAHLAVGAAQHYLGQVLASSPEPAHRQEAYDLVREWVDLEDSYFYRRGIAHSVLAKVIGDRGGLHEAEAHARKACELLAPFQADVVYARRFLSNILLARGKAAEAREVAALGVRELEETRGMGIYAVAIRLALAEACFAEGDAEEGEAALRQAVECVRARASDIPGPEARERFLRQVPENVRALELARQRWGETAA